MADVQAYEFTECSTGSSGYLCKVLYDEANTPPNSAWLKNTKSGAEEHVTVDTENVYVIDERFIDPRCIHAKKTATCTECVKAPQAR